MTAARLCSRLVPGLLLFWMACSSSTHLTGDYKIALVPARGGQRGLYVVNSDSTGAKLLSTQGTVQLRPESWSPDGKKIAYFSVGPGDATILNSYRIPLHFLLYLMDATVANQRRLLDFPLSSFAWSPDSEKMLLVSAYEDPQREDHDIVRGARQPVSAIYILDVRTGQQKRVTELGQHCSAAWSPDGTRLALSFGSERSSDIYVASLDGKHTRRLTDSSAINIKPVWSPNGKTLAYVAASVPGEETPGAGIYVTDAEGTNKKQVTNMMISEVSWSPEGKALLLQSVTGLYIVGPGGENLVKISGIVERPMDAVFTPDGQKVMFRSNHEGDWHLYTVDLSGANLRRIIGQLSASQFCASPLLH
jgi:Tol biopolymer transport system component